MFSSTAVCQLNDYFAIRGRRLLLVPASATSFRCFLMRMDPFSVHRDVFFGGPLSSQGCGDGAGIFFSLTQMSISANKKHSSSCHDTLSLPTRRVPYRRSFPNLSCVSHLIWPPLQNQPRKCLPAEIEAMPVVHAITQALRHLLEYFWRFVRIEPRSAPRG